MADAKVESTPEVPASEPAPEVVEAPKGVFQDEMTSVMAEIGDPVMEELAPVTEEAVKEPESQPEVESAPPEETADEVVDPLADVPVSDEDVDEVFTETKSNVQKRIDKLTAEKKAAVEQSSELQKRVDALETTINKQQTDTKSDGEFKMYSMENLKTALGKAREDGDLDLEIEVQQQIAKQIAYTTEKKYIDKQNANDASQREAQAVWHEVLVEYEPYKGTQLDPSNQNSLIFKTARKLLVDPDTKKRYSTRGARAYSDAVKDAHLLIVSAQLKKSTNKKTQTLEKKLVTERLKTQVNGASVPATQVVQSEEKPVSDSKSNFEDLMSSFNKTRGY